MLTARLLVLVAIAGLPLACSKTICNGVISCGRFDLETCAAVPGCTRGPGCDIRTNRTPSCAAAKVQADCAAPLCGWIADACLPACRAVTAETACNAHQSSDTDQYGNPIWTCVWVQCLGTPETSSCSQYSVEMCPADLGCRVEDPSGLPDN